MKKNLLCIDTERHILRDIDKKINFSGVWRLGKKIYFYMCFYFYLILWICENWKIIKETERKKEKKKRSRKESFRVWL